MSELEYKYLFPFEKVSSGARILIYGAGVLGQEYLKQIMMTEYCEVIGFVDKNYANYPSMIIPVYAPERIRDIIFDNIVIALRDGFGYPDIHQILMKQEVEESKIVCVFERAKFTQPLFVSDLTDFSEAILAYEVKAPSCALYLAGGFGDMICQKYFVRELMYLAPNLKFDIYVVKNTAYLQWLYSGCENLQNVLLDLGNRYCTKMKEYCFSISIFGSKFLQVDYVDSDLLEQYELNFLAKKIESLKNKCENERVNHSIPGAVAYRRRMYYGENCRTWFNYRDVFSISDKPVSIPVTIEHVALVKKLYWNRYKRYITINVGNGSTSGDRYIAKAWPIRYFQETVNMFKKKYPNVAIVQIGAADEPAINGTDFLFLGKDFGFVSCILQEAIFHLDIEGGLVHLASQLDTKCIVLFGPTPVEYFGYNKNINVMAGKCHGCAGLYSSVDQCARNMEQPECMYSITPRIVMEKIDKYMSSIQG